MSNLFGGDVSVPPEAVLPSLVSTEDVQLLAVNRDGSTTPVFDFSQDSPQEQTDPTGTELIVPMQFQNTFSGKFENLTLSPGTYQVELTGNTGLSYAISEAYLTEQQPLWDPTQPLIISTFTVLGKGATFDDASPLPIGPQTQTYTFSLNPDDYQSAVDLYKFTLAPGKLWQVGVSISTQNINSPLLTTLSIFDSNGNLVAERSAGEGLPNDPNDPYIFTGLTPTPQSDTYYIGVSGYGNSAYGSDGYDPILGIAGTAGMSQPGGPFSFELNVSAQPHDQATQLVGFSLDHADLHDPSPTSITLTFSGPIDLNNLFVPDQQETALNVVDSSGQIWPVTAEQYQTNSAQLTLIFDSALPSGQYSLIVPSTGGLTDLAGVPVVASGEPAGVLASWTVARASEATNPNDLGVLWPSKAGVVWPSAAGSFSGTDTLAPGQTVTYRWVVIVAGYYKLQTQTSGSEIEIENSANGKTTILDAGSTGDLNNYLMPLSNGVYELRMTNIGLNPVGLQWLLKVGSLDWEKIIDNGVSQANALRLTTLSPTLAGPDTGPISGLLSIAPSPAGDPFGATIGPVSASLFVTLNTALTGQPTWDGQAFGSAGTADGSAASTGSAIGQSLLTGNGSMLASVLGPVGDDNAGVIEQPAERITTNGGPNGTIAKTIVAHPGADDAGTHADVQALAQADWLGRLGSLVKDWFAASGPVGPLQHSPEETAAPRQLSANQAALLPDSQFGDRRNHRFISMVHSDAGAAVSVIMVCAVAYQLGKLFKNWLQQSKQLAAPRQVAAPRLMPGPYRMVKASRTTTGMRKWYSPR